MNWAVTIICTSLHEATWKQKGGNATAEQQREYSERSQGVEGGVKTAVDMVLYRAGW